MCINIPNNKRHLVVAEDLHNRCVVTSAAAATWWNVDVVDVQLLAIGHPNQNVLLSKGVMSLISRQPPLFLWRSNRTAVHPGVFSGLVLLVSFVSWNAAILAYMLWRKVSS